jgi:radical SAM superfamily enzyme YgiQ (UPF0313 family)
MLIQQLKKRRKSMEFEMSIKTGNQAMQTYDDLAASLEKIAKRIRDNRFDESGVIMDYNGNKIGTFYMDGLKEFADEDEGMDM